MRGIVNTLSVVGNVRKIKGVLCEDIVFWANYRVTSIIFCFSSFLVATRQYFDNPISCQPSDRSTTFFENSINLYCYVRSTYNCIGNGTGEIYPGIRNCLRGEKIRNDYYQWVSLVLVLQGAAFYFPHFLWKNLEGGLLRALVQDLSSPVLSVEDSERQLDRLLAYFYCHIHRHASYARNYLLCFLLSFLNIPLQFYLTDLFLRGRFADFVPKLFAFHSVDAIFPKMAMCEFKKLGPSGSQVNLGFLCLLPLNMLHEKIYIFLWFWLIFSFVINLLWFCKHMIELFFPKLRRLNAPQRVKSYINYGDWFLLRNLSDKIVEPSFTRLISTLGQINWRGISAV